MLSIKSRNNKASDIKLVYLYSTIKMMHGPIDIRFTTDNTGKTPGKVCKDKGFCTASCNVLGLFRAAVLQ